MAREKKSMIGFDPLSWLGDDEGEPDTKKKAATKSSKGSTIDVLGKSIDEVALTKSYGLIQDSLEEIISDFYQELFLQHPGVIPLFENTDEQGRANKLSGAIRLLFDNINDEDALVNVLTDLGSRHQAYGAEEAHYGVVAKILIDACHKYSGRKWTKKMTAAWESLLTGVAETMLSAYKDIDETADDSINENSSPTQANSQSDLIVLENIQDISKSEELKQKMLDLIKNSKDISIDAAAVSRIDGSALQLLCGFFQYAEIHDIKVSWIEPSDALIASSECLGVKKILDLDYFGLF